MIEQRRYNRLDMEITLEIKRIDGVIEDSFDVQILNVSKIGLGFYSDRELEIGSLYESYIMIWTKEKIHAILEITRVIEVEDGYHYGAFFVGMPELESQRITIYETVKIHNDNNY